MSLYDDFDKHRTEKVAGWSSGIKLLQSQLQLKKAATPQVKREQYKKNTTLAPVIDLKSKSRDIEKNDDRPVKNSSHNSSVVSSEFDWNVVNEYDPMWPNEYEKVTKELRDMRDREHDLELERKHRRENSSYEDFQPPISSMTIPEPKDEHLPTKGSNTGVTIAPPPSLQESVEIAQSPGRQTLNTGYTTSSVAAKIMAKYGFKEGQGIVKKKQGMSIVLQVEKTSKRGGRILHEKELNLMPPPPPPQAPGSPQNNQGQAQEEPSITEIMKSPSKVVLLRNMVGPGEVDEDLEPEVKDECNTKYGDVTRVMKRSYI